MAKGLRSFIAELEAHSPDDIARVKRPLSPRYEISALLTHLERAKPFPLLFCENVEGSKAPVVINALASRRLMALALQCHVAELAAKSSERPLSRLHRHRQARSRPGEKRHLRRPRRRYAAQTRGDCR